MKFINKDRVLSICLLAICAFFFVNIQNLKLSQYAGDPGPKMFPMIGIIVCVLCAVWLFIKPDTSEKKPVLTRAQLKSALVLLAIYGLIVLLMWLVGYTATVPIILFILCCLFSKATHPDISVKKMLLRSLIFTVIVSAALYLVYVVVLSTQLPKGILWK